ncbi:MAG: DJ-1/PfpI family protein [Candidatus Korobacteraceae bacterium]|jgi:transcriptional regulator GlxA family with amidase domain
MKIRIIVFDGVDEIDFIGPYEVFRRAAKLAGANTAGASATVDVRLVTVEPQAQVTAANGLRFLPDGVLEDAADLLVVPGGGWADRSPRSLYTEVQRGLLPKKIAALHPRCTILAAVCTGAMALAAAGLLKDRPAVTHRSALHELRSAGAQIVDARVVDDGDIVTCGGVTSSIDLALWLVERIWGAPMSAKIATGMEYTRNPSLHRSKQAAG